MKKPTQLSDWDFSDIIQVPDGWDMTSEPDLTRRNFNKLLDEYNNLAEVVGLLCEKLNIEFEEK